MTGDETRTCADEDEDLGGRDPRLRRHALPLSHFLGSPLDCSRRGAAAAASEEEAAVRSFGKGKASERPSEKGAWTRDLTISCATSGARAPAPDHHM